MKELETQEMSRDGQLDTVEEGKVYDVVWTGLRNVFVGRVKSGVWSTTRHKREIITILK